MHHTRAAVLEEARGAVSVREVALREPGTGEVLVRMEACGVCHSDLFVAGLEKLPLLPLTLGHEGIGRIEAVGAGVTGWAPGDRAGITFLGSTCGVCEPCRTGHHRYCSRQLNFGYTLNGALTPHAIVPAVHLARVPEGLTACEAAPLCCAGWTAYSAVRESGAQTGQTVALYGMGGLGHLAVQYARHFGVRVAAVDVAESKLEMARALGAEFTASGDAASRAIQKELGGADAAIVLTASPAAVQQAFRSLKRLGTLVLVGLASASYDLPIVDTVLKGIRVRGSYLGTAADLEAVFQLAAQRVAVPRVQAHELDETPELLARMRGGELLGRAVIAF